MHTATSITLPSNPITWGSENGKKGIHFSLFFCTFSHWMQESRGKRFNTNIFNSIALAMFRHYDTTHLAHSSNANQIERRENISVRWFAFSCFISPENQPTIGEFGVLNNRKFTCCWFSDNQPIYTPLGPQNPNQYEPNIRYSNFHLLQSPLLSSNYENILVDRGAEREFGQCQRNCSRIFD